MALFCGKVLVGKYSGYNVDVSGFLGSNVKIGLNDVSCDIKSVSLVGSSMKTDLIFSLKPLKNYYQVQVTWFSGGESILEVNNKALDALNMWVEINNQ